MTKKKRKAKPTKSVPACRKSAESCRSAEVQLWRLDYETRHIPGTTTSNVTLHVELKPLRRPVPIPPKKRRKRK